jgi:hypothetical protein
LPEKKFKCQPNKKEISCLILEEFPREVSEAAIEILIAKDDQERKARLESDSETETSKLKEDLKRLEDKLDKVMTALRIKTT